MADKPLGKITHYYDKIGVAVVELKGPLAVGDTVKISGHEQEFTQKIGSMQVEHEQLQKAQKGKVIGLKVDQAVKEGDLIYNAD